MKELITEQTRAMSFKSLITDFTDAFCWDHLNLGIPESESEVSLLAEQCVRDGISLAIISLARKAAVIEACSPNRSFEL